MNKGGDSFVIVMLVPKLVSINYYDVKFKFGVLS